MLPNANAVRLACLSALALLLSVELLAAERPAVGVIATSVLSQPFHDEIEALGTVSANEAVDVTSKVSATIVSLYFQDGQTVRRGELLVQLDDAEEQANLRSLEALLVERESALRRAQELFSRRVGSEADVDAARARVDQTRADIAAVKARLDAHQIRAAFDGVLGLRDVSVGTLIVPGERITTLDDLSSVKVDFPIPALYLAQLRPGLRVTGSTGAYPDQVFNGELRSVSSRVDPVTRTISARVLFPNRDRRLKPGLLMQVRLQANPRQALVLPESAIFAVGRQHFVHLIAASDPPIARRHPVVLGVRQHGRVEILSGLEVGQQVVSHGGIKLGESTAVTIQSIDTDDDDLTPGPEPTAADEPRAASLAP